MIRSTGCNCSQALAAFPNGAPPSRAGVGAVTLPYLGAVDTKWLLLAAAAVAVYLFTKRRRRTVRSNRAKRIIRRVTEF